MPKELQPKPLKINEIPLNSAQKAAVEAPHAPLLIVAGAGTGKTKTLTSRIIYLMESGMRPERICAITFTNKAAKEMENRVHSSYPLPKSADQRPFLGTFHSLGAKILRKECKKLGRGFNFAIFDDHDSFELVKKAVKAIIPPKRNEDGALDKKDKKETPVFFAQKISELKNLDELSDARLNPEKKAQVQRVFEKYEQLLLDNNAFDFDDLIQKVVYLFETDPHVLQKYQRMFDAVLIDEYQDINPKQYRLVSLLAGEHKNLSAVGDDEQTIYSWRYANIKTFLNFDKEWKDANICFLEENYRSTGTIIRAASSVAKNNRFRTPKNLWTQNPEGERITLFEAWGENEEAEWVASKIDDIRSADTQADIGILYRTNAQSRAIEQALLRYNIPYRIFGGLKFYERREIKDAVAALRFISNPQDEVAKDRLEKNLTKRKFAEFRLRAQRAENLPPLEAIKIFLESFGYFDYLESNFINSDEREENIAELVAFSSGFTSLPELLERLSLLQAADEIGTKTAAGREVNLMTVHLAKGLEFDTVFLMGVAEGFLPHGRSLQDEASIEEERRLMYVAMTRARKKLYLSFFGMPSRFISEIPEDCITLANEYGNSSSVAHGNAKDDFYADENSGEENSVYWE